MLREKLSEDLKNAMKSADQTAVGVLRLLISAINNKAIEKRGKTGNDVLTDDEVMQVLVSEAKKRNDSITIFDQGGRPDLANKEKKELEILKKYLPVQVSEEEVERVVEKVIKQGDVSFGNVMKEVMKELKGKADAKLISEIIKGKLGK